MKPQLRQYFGPTPRHGHAGIELSFPDDGTPQSLEPLAAVLRGSRIHLPRIDAPMALPQLIGTVVHRLLSRPTGPLWSQGREDGLGWVNVTFPSPQLLAQTLWLVYHAIRNPGGPAVNNLLGLQDRYGAVSAYTTVVQMASSLLDFDAVRVSSLLGINQLGQCAKALHVRELGSDRDSATFSLFARNKAATVALLQRAGLPTTRALPVRDVEGVQAAARAIGFPCVVKPINRGQGAGITTGIKNSAMLRDAVDFALEQSPFPLLVEDHIFGDDHRIVVIDGEMLWAYRRRAADVVGTGDKTLLELVEDLNAARAGIEGAHSYLKQIAIDEALTLFLRDRHGLTLQSVPARGQRLELAGVANVAKGGALSDVTARVHPDNREMVLRVARLFRANAIGIDFMTPDISRSWKDVRCAIIEVNATPGILSLGDGCHAVRALMPQVRSGLVPSFVIAGTDAYCAGTAREVATLLDEAGIAHTGGRYLRRPPEPGYITASQQHEEVEQWLLDPDAEALIVTCRCDDIERFGLPLQRADLLLTDDPAVADRFRDRVARAAGEAQDIRRLVTDTLGRTRGDSALEPRPSVEWLAPTSKVRCWRLRTVPSAAFWRQIPEGSGREEGMVDQRDVLTAVETIANGALARSNRSAARISLSAQVPPEGWDHPYVDADLAISADADPAATAEALQHAIATVNRILDWPKKSGSH